MTRHRLQPARNVQPAARSPVHQPHRNGAAAVLQRAQAAPMTLQPGHIQQLQRTVGNRATAALLQTKLQLGPADDPYEREADQMARQVVRRMAVGPSAQASAAPLLQRQPLARQITPITQRQEMDEEELQAKRTAQRQEIEDEELQAKPIAQRQEMDEDEELQAKRAHGPEGGDVAPDVERSIQASRGGGRPLDEPVRRSMENAFGADFSRVRIHTGGQADALNQTLQAKAFTTGQDIFFRGNAYAPQSQGGQELLAHELTHVVQQNGPAVQPKRQQTADARTFRKPHSGLFQPRPGKWAGSGARVQREILQRDEDEPGRMSKTLDVGDITGAIVEVYEAYNGDESASTIVKAIGELSGNLADTKGGAEELGESTEASGVGFWSRVVGGVTGLASKGSEAVGTLAEYGKSALDYAASFGYGSDYLQQSASAVSWIGSWAKSASDLINPYKYYTDLVSASSKAATGLTDGWKAGTVLEDLDKLVRTASTRDLKNAAELIFNIAWWKRLEAYAKGSVGAIEGGATLFLGPLSKGITTVATKSYETGWAAYLLRAMGSSFTGEVYSNAQVKQQADRDADALTRTVNPIVATGKVKDIVELCKAAIDLGMGDFARAIVQEFDRPPTGKEERYTQRKAAFVEQAQRKGIANALRM